MGKAKKGGQEDQGEVNKEHGEPTKYDPSFNGPIKNRGCTDVICCVLFCLCFLGMIAVAVLAFARGDPTRLLYPTDTDGNICGTGNFADKPNLFFFDMTVCARMGAGVVINGCPTPQVCVQNCPNITFYWKKVDLPGVSESDVRKELFCKNKVNPLNPSKVCVDTCPSTYWAWYASTITGDSPAERQKMICKSSVNATKSSKVCTDVCPVTEFTWHQVQKKPEYIDKMICRRSIDASTSTRSIKALVEDEDCAAYYVQSTDFAGRCIPSIFEKLFNKTLSLTAADGTAIVNKLNETVTGTQLEEGTKYLAIFLSAKEYGVKVYQDVRAAWWMLLVGLGLAMLVSFIWIIIMRWIACPMVWFSIIAFMGLFGFATYYCISKYLSLKNNEDSKVGVPIQFKLNLDYYGNLAITWLVFGCAAGIILLITLLLVIFLFKRIMIAISLIQESSKAVGSMIFTLFYPLIPFLLEVILFGFWGASAIYLASMGTQTYGAFNKTLVNETVNGYTQTKEVITSITDKIDCSAISGNSSAAAEFSKFCNFIKYGGDEYTIYLQFFQLFMLLWCMNLIVAFGQMVLAGAFASYYWAFHKPKDIPMFPLAASTWRTLRYHLGTLAFGSLIIAIIQMIRIALEYLDAKLKGAENPAAKFFLKCLKCCFWCLEKFMKFLNKNAYIMCAIYGKNFCASAKNAFLLILRNIVRVAVVDKVTDWVLLLSKLFVVGAIGLLSTVFFSGELANYIPDQAIADNIRKYTPSLNNYMIPVAIICLGSYVIAAAFFSVYGMAVDTLFLCFLEDLERNDGSEEKPYYMSKGLMKLLGKKNKREKKD